LIFEKIPERKFPKNKIKEVMQMWQLVIVFILGFAVGFMLAQIILVPKVVGVLRVDRSDPDEAPYLFLECEKTPDLNQKYVTFEVLHKNYISQK
jgi:energy-converting hydrogenase Eha subunit F